MENKLVYKIENAYVNSKLTKENISEISNIYNNIYSIIEKNISEYNISPKINQHGSYALNTIILQKNEEIDLDLGLLLNIDDLIEDNKLKKMLTSDLKIFCNPFNKLKKELISDLKKKLKVKYKLKSINDGKCAFSIKMNNFHIDIAMYLEIDDEQYLFYENNSFILDNKHKQYDVLKKILSNNDELKKMICFIKYVYKNIDKKIYKKYNESKISSIALTEVFVLTYINNKKYKFMTDNDIGYKLLNYLIIIHNKLINNFSILNSGNRGENLINNHKRKLDYENTLYLLGTIIDELEYLYENNEICKGILTKMLKNDKIFKNIKYHKEKINKSKMLEIKK